MLTATNISKDFGSSPLFQDVSLQFNPGCRYGIVGANGSGKSTLLKIFTGDIEASTGTVSIPKKIRVGTLKQDHFEYEDVPIIDVVMMGNAELYDAIQEKEKLLANASESFDMERYGDLEDIILRYDGYSLEARAAEILEGLNIPTQHHHKPLRILSGGFKLRALLGQVLAAEPDLLMLDEPTNHLDIVSIAWLEQFLAKFRGCAIVVSHDHRFLDTVCSHIVDVDYQLAMLYTGNYSAFTAAKAEERERRQKQITKREKEIEEHQKFIDRFKAKASKARQAQSKAKKVAKMVIEKLPESSRRYPKLEFKQQRPSGRDVLTCEGIDKSYDDKIVLMDVGFQIKRGERVAIIGPNGIGKSTLLKILTGNIEADSPETTSVEWGYETHVGYFAQDHSDVLGHTSDTVLSWLWDRKPSASVGYIRGKLAMALFTKDEVDKKVANLSGGESARLIFTAMAVDLPNVLILDEPTNHLDLEGIEALCRGLEAYEGTMIFVSHDRWFVSRLANRIIELNEDGIDDFKGSWSEYLQKNAGDDHLDHAAVAAKAKSDKRAKKKKNKGK